MKLNKCQILFILGYLSNVYEVFLILNLIRVVIGKLYFFDLLILFGHFFGLNMSILNTQSFCITN